MKRVLIFSLAYYPHVGGAEVALKEITNRISDIEFHLITLNFSGDAKEEKIGAITVHRVGHGASYLGKILFVPRAVLYATRLHMKRPFDAFWAVMSYMLFPVVLLRFMGIRVPYLLTLQEGDPWKHMFGRWFILPFRPLLSVGFKNASAVQAISNFLAAWAVRAGYSGIPEVVGNGADIGHFSRSYPQDELNELSRALGKRGGETYLITTSRLVEKNACDDVIRALPLLPASVKFLLLGVGPEEAALRSLSKKLGVEDRVQFLGFIGHGELPKYLALADIYIRPSRSEGMGNVFIEAMASELPVIATQEGGIADFLFDAKRNPDKPTTGWAVDKNSPEQIAEAVKDILANPEQVARVKATAKKLAIEKYDWNLIAEQMQSVFVQVLDTPKR